MQNVISSFLFSFVYQFNITVLNLLNQNGVREERLSTTDDNREKEHIIIIFWAQLATGFYQRMSNLPLAYSAYPAYA